VSKAFKEWWKRRRRYLTTSERETALEAFEAGQKVVTPQWQPIETAPEDGIDFLVVVELEDGQRFVEMTRYSDWSYGFEGLEPGQKYILWQPKPKLPKQ